MDAGGRKKREIKTTTNRSHGLRLFWAFGSRTLPVGMSWREAGIALQIGEGMVTGLFMAGEDREEGEAEERMEVCLEHGAANEVHRRK